MKRTLLNFILVALASMVCITTWSQSIVLSEDFESATFSPGWQAVDNDGDGTTWQLCSNNSYVSQVSGSKQLAISFTRDPQNYSTVLPAQDNWLITPPITVSSNAFVLEFRYAAQDLDKTEPLSILISETGTDFADFTEFYKETVDNGYEDDIVISTFKKSLSEYEGKTIRIAFRHNASATYGLSIDNVFVYNQQGPNAPTTFTAKSDATGANKVTLSWTNPAKCANGDDLGEFSIEIYRDGEHIASVTNGLVAGETAEWTDENAPNGNHSYTIAAKNAAGEGKKLSAKAVYVGEDVPSAVKDPIAMAAADGRIIIKWTAPTTGANKGAFNIENVTYNILRSVDGTETTIAENVKECSYTDNAPAGKLCVYAIEAVNSAGHSAIADHTAAIAFGDDVCEQSVAQTDIKDNALNRLPIEINSKYSVSQSVYYPKDLGFVTGDITKLVYKAYKGTDTDLDFPVKLYMRETTSADLSGGWDDMTDATLVYDGSITLSQGSRDLMIELSTPFDYKGGNLVVTFIKSDAPSGSYSDRFYSVVTDKADRSYTTSTYNPIDITNLPTSSYSDKKTAELPSTRFIISPKGVGSLSGKVTNATTAAPVENATITVEGYEGLSALSDASGNYIFDYVPVNATQITVTRTGYQDATADIAISDGNATVKDIVLNQLPFYTLSGKVVANDTKLPAEGAVIALDGYESVSATAGEDGSWSIANVYSGKDYTLTVSYPIYDSYKTDISNESEDAIDLGLIALERAPIPPFALEAEVATDGSAVALSWSDPLSRDVESGWKSIGDVSEQKYTGGDYYCSDYSIAHYFSPEDLASMKMEGLAVSNIKVYIKATAGTFTAKVWEGDRDNHKEISSQSIPAEMISSEGAWVTVKLDEPAELRVGKGYLVGVNCVSASSSPFGTSSASTVYDGNNLKWSDAEGQSTSNGYSSWCIMAECIIPGTDAEIAPNPDAPKCAYNVYRERKGSDTGWEQLTPSPINETSHNDDAWASLTSGEYRYAVTAVYQNVESEKALSYVLNRSVDYDLGVTAFVSPMKSVEMQTAATVTVKVTNFGEKPVTNFSVAAKLNDGTPINKDYEGSLAKGDTTEITVGSIELTEGINNIEAYTVLEGDQMPANDALSFSLPNLKNIQLMGYRWDAYGNAGFMKIQSNNPEAADFLKEVTPNDALIIAGECVGGTFYGYTATWWGESREFIGINTQTWTVDEAVENTDDYIIDMTYDYKGKTMYGLRPDGTSIQLVKIDMKDGSTEPVGTTGIAARTLACDLEGKLYSVTDDGNFYSLDSSTGEATLIGSTGIGKAAYLQSMAFDHNTGRLFYANTSNIISGALYEIEPATGAAYRLGTAMFNGNVPSEIVGLYTPYTHEEPVGVDTNRASREIVSKTYYSALGIRMPAPAARDGQMYIVVTKYSDGSTSTEKVVND